MYILSDVTPPVIFQATKVKSLEKRKVKLKQYNLLIRQSSIFLLLVFKINYLSR